MRRGGDALVLAVFLAAGAGGVARRAPARQSAWLPLSHQQVVELAEGAIAKQHLDDVAGEKYERIERQIVRRADGSVIEDKTYRVVPTGTGTLKLLLREGKTPVPAAAYANELRQWIGALEDSQRTSDPAMRSVFEKAEKKRRDRAEIVDATRRAYLATGEGMESIAGRPAYRITLALNPQFQPRTTAEEVLVHARPTIWIDQRSGHLAKGEAEITSDVYFGAGILGKIYRGGRFTLEQEEVSPGVWQPRSYRYDVSGRKFLFPFELHRTVESSGYRKLGGVEECLAVAKQDLAAGKTPLAGDP